jgi:hypothetical protein
MNPCSPHLFEYIISMEPFILLYQPSFIMSRQYSPDKRRVMVNPQTHPAKGSPKP